MSREVADRETGNGNWSPFVGLPAWSRFVGVIGIPSAVALFLVWRLDGRQTELDSRQATQLASLSSQVASQTLILSTVQRASDDAIAEQRRLTSLMRQVCLNTARTDAQRLECGR